MTIDIALLDQSVDELAHLVGVVQAVPRRSCPVAVFGMAHNDADTVVQDGIKRILIGQIITEEDR